MKRRHSVRLIDKPTKTIKMENDDGKRIYSTVKAANVMFIDCADKLKSTIKGTNAVTAVSQQFDAFLDEHVKVVRKDLLKKGDVMFQPVQANDDDYYVYDYEIKMGVSDTNGRNTNKWSPWFQVRKSDFVCQGDHKCYGLFALREFKKDEILGLYMGTLVDDNAEKENGNYRFHNLNPRKNTSYMGMHYINDPLYPLYCEHAEKGFVDINAKVQEAKKKKLNKVNVKIMTDYLVRATKRINVGNEITTYYNWHLK